MSPATAPLPARALVRPLRIMLCLATLVALFAMHGPTVDHTLEVPMGATSSTIAATGGVQAGRVDAAAITTSDPSMAGMHHPQCLATMRPAAHLPAVAVTVVHSADKRLELVARSERGAPERSPPRPSLNRMCISRT